MTTGTMSPNARIALIAQFLKGGGSLTAERVYPRPFNYSLKDASGKQVLEMEEAAVMVHVAKGEVVFRPKSPGDFDHLVGELRPPARPVKAIEESSLL